MLIDGGNANFRDTQRRHAKLPEQGIHFLGVGVSGGEEGALNGPSIMPGGDEQPYDESVKPIFEAIAAEVDGTPCVTYVGADGAGHFVKMVHNGIEYADMQLIAESYDLLRHACGLEVAEIGQRFEAWNETELESFLIEITARVLAKTDERDRQAAGRRDPRRRRPEGHRPLDRAERARARRAADRDHRGGVRAVAERAEVRARRTPPTSSRARAERGGRRVARRRPRARAVRVEDRRLRAGLSADGGGRRRRGLEHRPRRDGDDLARRLHHPRPLSGPDPRGLRRRARARRT